MAKLTTALPLADLAVDGDAGAPLYRRLYENLRRAILEGRLAPGARLPSTRELAAELSVSRNTVLNAFEQLLAEGYVEGQTGSGTFVSKALPDELLNARAQDGRASRRTAAKGRLLSRRGLLLANTPVSALNPHVRGLRPFRVGVPALDVFPYETWSKILQRHWRRPRREMFATGDPAGYLPLREAIASYLGAARAVRCTPEQVIVVTGTQQAVDILARVLLDPGDSVWVEDYGYIAARSSLVAAGARLVPVPVDEEGINVREGERLCARARLAYVAPSHQYPLGVTLSLARRLELLEWASRAGAWVVEDDYDSEFRYAGRPLAAMQGLDAEGRVIYLGTFSKVLFPSLRMGYMVVPLDMAESLRNARALVGWCSPVVDQAVVADFINEGHFARHIRRMRTLYAERQAALVEAARESLGGLLEINPADAGLHLVGWLPEGTDDRAASDAAAAQGLQTQPLSAFGVRDGDRRAGLVLGYAAFDEREIREGVKRLRTALSQYRLR
ncbi:MAG TPA: PLP-dependent aminotransferase family protein [Pyrinomonadaceae bacterium]|nr:PLP-dependent aminotransferase family protein [Pyrinomonadaceae bacterium]